MIATAAALLVAGAIGAFMFLPWKGSGAAPPPQPTPTPTVAARTAAVVPTPIPLGAAIGGVVRQRDGVPVPSASVFLVRRISDAIPSSIQAGFADSETGFVTASTDATGRFRIAVPDAWKSGPMLVGIRIDEEPQLPAVEVPSLREAREVPLTMPDPLEVRGFVLDDARRPVGGVTVELLANVMTARSLSERTTPRKTLTRTTVTAADGRYTFTLLEPETLTLRINTGKLKPGLFAERPPVNFTREDFHADRYFRSDFAIVRGADLEATLVQSADDFTPVVGASLELRGAPRAGSILPVAVYSATSDGTGRVRLANALPGRYLVTASHPGYNKTVLKDWDTSGTIALRLAMMPHATVRGSITTKAAAGTEVMLEFRQRAAIKPLTTSVGEGGRITFETKGLENGAYDLWAFIGAAPAIESANLSFTVGGGTEIVLPTIVAVPLEELTVRLLTSREFPDVSDLALRVIPSDASSDSGTIAVLPPATRSEDFTIFGLRKGAEYRIEAFSAANTDPAAAAIVIGGGAKELRLLARGTGTLVGSVLNRRHEACSSTTVELTAGLGNLEGTDLGIQTRRTVTTFDGKYRFEAVPIGQARLLVGGEADTTRLVSIQANRTADIPLVCRIYIPVTFEFSETGAAPIDPDEQIVVVAQAGTVVKKPVHEFKASAPAAALEPGRYSVMRTRTMKSTAFEIQPLFRGIMRIDFANPSPLP